jgi:hypothetical protein
MKNAVEHLHNIGVEIENIGFKPFKIAEWQSAVLEFSEADGKLDDHFEGLPKENDEREQLRVKSARGALQEISRYANSGVPFHGHPDYEKANISADRTRLIVVQGEPGAGKSHLFADAVSSALSEKSPAILMLGQNFYGDIRKSFLRGLGMPDQDFEAAMQALNSAGELAGQRVLVLIDALNEAIDLRIWPNELAGFAAELLKYEHISLGVSLRPEYLDVLIPQGVKNNAKCLPIAVSILRRSRSRQPSNISRKGASRGPPSHGLRRSFQIFSSCGPFATQFPFRVLESFHAGYGVRSTSLNTI